jgi:hypothetical protein
MFAIGARIAQAPTMTALPRIIDAVEHSVTSREASLRHKLHLQQEGASVTGAPQSNGR